MPLLLGHASEMEVERDHALGRTISNEDDIFAAEADLLAQAEAGATEVTDEGLLPFEALGSQATFDRVLYDGGEFGHAGEVHVGSEEEMDFLGIPGLLEPDQVRHLLQKRQTDRANLRRRTEPATERGVTTHERLAILRRELQLPRRRLAPPHRCAARRHPHGSAQGARWPGRRRRLRRPARPAHRQDPGLGPRRLSLRGVPVGRARLRLLGGSRAPRVSP